VYLGSFTGFFVFSWPVAFAPNAGAPHVSSKSAPLTLLSILLAVLILFRFITGLCGAAFLSVAGGTVSDLFSSSEIAT
jgi:MFS family permease